MKIAKEILTDQEVGDYFTHPLEIKIDEFFEKMRYEIDKKLKELRKNIIRDI